LQCYGNPSLVLFCQKGYALDFATETCNVTCPSGKTRSPGSNRDFPICNMTCDGALTNCAPLSDTNMRSLTTGYACPGGLRMGYRCYGSLGEGITIFNFRSFVL